MSDKIRWVVENGEHTLRVLLDNGNLGKVVGKFKDVFSSEGVMKFITDNADKYELDVSNEEVEDEEE